ncbi:MAG: alpha/beta hydrolase [Kiloniellales bacterium]|nr:alpha/beta hydrolase [Kiloniellales bacterium]
MSDAPEISSNPSNSQARFLDRANGVRIAYQKLDGRNPKLPGLMFLGGFMSDMTGTKALYLEEHAKERGQAFLRLDYRGHGASSGRFEDGTIGLWAEDALGVFDSLSEGPQVLVGSSMGGWISLLVARSRPDRVSALVGIAAAPDFTKSMWESFSSEIRETITRSGRCEMPSDYDDNPYVITKDLIEDGANQCLLGGKIPIKCPVRLLQGTADTAVPWQTAMALLENLESEDAEALLVKDGDHRLSSPKDLARLSKILDQLSGLNT